MSDTRSALMAFTQRYCQGWQQQSGHGPVSSDLIGLPSPCIVTSDDHQVEWHPVPCEPATDLSAVERALEITLQPDAHQFWCSQYAGDMAARREGNPLTLLQAWSECDFQRAQENIIGHLVMQRRLKISPTVFLATTDDELTIISLCNLTGEVVLEKLGTPHRTTLARGLSDFLQQLDPVTA
ncbi:SecY-interacting protein [Shimwellia pseudoproteus]|uniref:SecY-interacting protein n=1 Tax=Shimwellia pseudoproteus TaxID=570012 RepID=UPI0018EB8DF2|nr:SecY-interacting protein [Shimwellia pseudoproteus]